MLSGKERTDLVNVARLYYEQGLTQDQVARRIGVSRPLVSKMLARAREAGIVHIEIRAADEGDAALLTALQAKYALAVWYCRSRQLQSSLSRLPPLIWPASFYMSAASAWAGATCWVKA